VRVGKASKEKCKKTRKPPIIGASTDVKGNKAGIGPRVWSKKVGWSSERAKKNGAEKARWGEWGEKMGNPRVKGWGSEGGGNLVCEKNQNR